MKKIIWIVIVIVVIGGIVWMNKSKKPAMTGETIKIGAPLELSGEAASYGENAKKGIDLAVKEYNAIHEQKVQVIYEDNHTEATQALSAYRKLVSVDRVSAIIGPLFQTQAGALLPVIKADNMPTVMISPVPLDSRDESTNPITVWMDPSEEAGQLAKYVFSTGIKKVAILGSQDTWDHEVSNAFESEFKSIGGEITAKEIMLPEERDTRSVVTKVLSTKPEAVFIGTYYQFIPVVKNLNELGFKGGRYGIEVDAYLAGETKPASNNLKFISPNFYTKDFADKFKVEYGEVPVIPAGQAYDAMYILLSFMEGSKDKKEVLSKMAKFKTFDGVTGKMFINDKHRVTFPTSIFSIQNGEIVHIKDN